MMSQDGRYYDILKSLKSARRTLHFAAELAQYARIPTSVEWTDVEDLLRQINRECVRIHEAINV